MSLTQGQTDKARQELEKLVVPKLASSELRNRHQRLLDKAKDGSTSPLTHLRVGTPGFDGQSLPIGSANLPFRLPAGITQVAFSGNGVMTLRLPKDAKAGMGGVVALIAASETMPVKVTLMAGGKRLTRAAQQVEAGAWTPVIIALDASDPVVGVEFTAGETGKRIQLYGAGAVFHATRAATIADLDLVPGALRPLPVSLTSRDARQDYSALIRQLSDAGSEFASLDRVVIAAPDGGREVANKVLGGLVRMLDLPPVTASDQRIVTFDTADTLEAAFATAVSTRANLFVVVVDTTRMPRPTTALDQVKRCTDAMAKGTLPVLLLSHHYESDAALRKAWDGYVGLLRKEIPSLPIIDGGIAPRFLHTYAATLPDDDQQARRLRDQSLGAGFVELVARLRAVITLNGSGR